MSSDFWFLDREHKQCGPVGEDEFVRLIRRGTIGRETQIWTAGMSEWRMAGQVDRFAALFGTSGPPSIPLKKYVYNETRYTMLAQSDPQAAAALLTQAEKDVLARRQLYEHWASLPVTKPV